jgi:septal ring factor EnvC (AmiA/AmiB activator)
MEQQKMTEENGKHIALIGFVIGIIILFLGIIHLVVERKKQETVFNQTIKQYEQMIKQRDEQIQQLQTQLEALQKEQVIREKKIVILKKQREQIQKPKTAEDTIKEFKELGYDAYIK